jgi:hypothetical protein
MGGECPVNFPLLFLKRTGGVVFARGTEGSNPSLSTGESDANLTSVSLRDRDRSEKSGGGGLAPGNLGRALVDKGITLGALSRREEEIAVYDDLLAPLRHGDPVDPA